MEPQNDLNNSNNTPGQSMDAGESNSGRKSKKKIVIAAIIVILMMFGGSAYAFRHFFMSGRGDTNGVNGETDATVDKGGDNEVKSATTGDLASPGWKSYSFEHYGFSFMLPEEWMYVKSDIPAKDGVELIPFEHRGSEYYQNGHNLKFNIAILDNPGHLPYEELFHMGDRPDLTENYYADEANITIDGVPAKLVYNNPDFKDGPIVYIPQADRYVVIGSPKEGDEFFNDFLATFKLFEPLDTPNTATPETKQEFDNVYDWCDNAPNPGKCFAGLAQSEENPDVKICEKITPENSGSEGFYYHYVNECYTHIAVRLKDISLCNNMKGAGAFEINKQGAEKNCKSRLYYEFALDNSDVSFCAKMDNDTFVDRGYAMDTITKLNCYVAVAVKANDQHLCDNVVYEKTLTGIISKEWCYYYYALVKKDCSLVPEDSPASVSQCEVQVENDLAMPGINNSAGIQEAQDRSKAPEDADGDGITDDDEIRYDSDPNNPDTDGDGYNDGDEVKNGYDPNGPGWLIVSSYISEQLSLLETLDSAQCEDNFQPACCLLDDFMGEPAPFDDTIKTPAGLQAVAGQLLIIFDDGVGPEEKLRVIDKYGGTIIGCTAGIVLQVEFRGMTAEELYTIEEKIDAESSVSLVKFNTIKDISI